MRVPLVQVDAFAETLFEGNPAAVMPLGSWLPDAVLQQVALKNNLSETAFLVAHDPVGGAAPDDAAEVVVERLARDGGEDAGQLHAGGPRTDDDEGLQRPPLLRLLLLLLLLLDSRRLCEFVYRNLGSLTQIVPFESDQTRLEPWPAVQP